MLITHYLRFKVSNLDKRIYHLIKKYISEDIQILGDNSLELHQELLPEVEILHLFSNDYEIAEICFPDDKFCYGHFENSQDLIIGKRILKKKYIELFVIKDQLEYAHIHYQALKNRVYRQTIKEIKEKL